MLVLTRGQGEAVVLLIAGQEICRITVVAFKSNPEVRLGFEAPATVQIKRAELASETDAEREARRANRIASLRKQADDLEKAG